MILHLLAGAFAGFLVGLSGIGGGAVMTPILLLIFKVEPITAVATDLWFAAFTKVASSITHLKQKNVQWSVVKRLWLGSLSATLLTTTLINSHYSTQQHHHYIMPLIAVMVLLTAVLLVTHSMFIKQRLFTYTLSENKQKVLTVAAGALIGTLVSLTSIGAGVLGTLILFYLYPKKLTPATIVGTETLHAIPLALLAGCSYLVAGKTDLQLLSHLLLGSIPGAIVGSMITSRLSSTTVRYVLSTVLFFSGIKMLV